MASRARMIRTATVSALAIGALGLTARAGERDLPPDQDQGGGAEPGRRQQLLRRTSDVRVRPEPRRRAQDHVLHIRQARCWARPHSRPPGDVANGDNQRTVLVGDTGTPGSPDYVDSVLADFLSTISAGGAVCWESIDCVSWGSFTGAASLPSPPGNPAAAIPTDRRSSARLRPTARRCSRTPTTPTTASPTSRSPSPSPRNNSVTPTETACTAGNGPDTSITKGPKKKTKKKKAKFEFSSTTPGATFECSVDGKPFEACSSPFKVKVKKGKHSFEVRAVVAGDPRPVAREAELEGQEAEVTRARRIALAGAVALAGAGLMATASIGATDLKLREVHDGGPTARTTSSYRCTPRARTRSPGATSSPTTMRATC